jgi:hypothetical protein
MKPSLDWHESQETIHSEVTDIGMRLTSVFFHQRYIPRPLVHILNNLQIKS